MDAVLVNAEEASARLGISRTAVYGLVRDKRLKSCKIGRRRLIRVADLEQFANQLAGDSIQRAAR